MSCAGIQKQLRRRITVVYTARDGGWYKVMRDGICIEDFRDRGCADSFARALRKEAAAKMVRA